MGCVFGVQGLQMKQHRRKQNDQSSLLPISGEWNEVRVNVPSNPNQSVVLSFHEPETSKQLCQQPSEGDQALSAMPEAFTMPETDTHPPEPESSPTTTTLLL